MRGIVGLVAVEGNENLQILRHEKVRPERSKLMSRHLVTVGASSSPISLTYKNDELLEKIINKCTLRDPVLLTDNEEMKQTINSFQEGLSKEKRIDFQEQIRICIERNHLWVERKTSNPEVMAELYDNNVGLAQCLRDKGVEVADPTQENPKINLQSSGMSREELKEKLEECSEEGWSLGRGKK